MTMTTRKWLVGMACAIGIGLAPAALAETLTLKVHHFLPPGSTAHAKFIVPWCEKVQRESGDRITDSQVKVRVSVPGWVDVENRLEPMKVADAVTFGNYFVLSDLTLNWISVQVQRAGKDAVKADFQYSTGRE